MKEAKEIWEINIDNEIMQRRFRIKKIKKEGYQIVNVKNQWKLIDNEGNLLDSTCKGCFKENAERQFIDFLHEHKEV